MVFGCLRALTRAARVLGVAAGISRGRVRIARYQATKTVSFSGRSGPASLEKEGALTVRRKGRALRLLLQEAEAPWAVVLRWVAMSSAPGPHGAVPAGEEQNMTETDAFSSSEILDPAEKYKMDHKRRGIALIFNHERFFWHLTLPERRGTSADRDNLKRRFLDLGFEVKCFDDLKAEELLLTIHEASTSSHVDADCFLCVFLSHGEGSHIYAYDAKIEIQTLTGLFKGDKCQSLVGKPKIFIIQACRGNQHDVPVIPLDVVDHKTARPDANVTQVDAASVYTLPAGADFLMCYSVAEGYYSHRETVNGSWYIQDLCEMLRKFGSSLEFTELLTLVNRKVSQRRVDFCKDRSAIGKKQVPCFASMLTKKLYFSPKYK
ncbi:caspase 6 [Rhinolophus ferrumequinum]|uniref:Caspase-6 n=1 Tax=Rhinolophus ferrumequinum TaxID=59479 RepID=A0A671E421_RHIFE|nr:caspase-6 [Rhinolophus ferrumequinum]KAF6371484.1 caspase 6 [Rhinolophus ferrumequinum]